jgi:hypothetical protein
MKLHRRIIANPRAVIFILKTLSPLYIHHKAHIYTKTGIYDLKPLRIAHCIIAPIKSPRRERSVIV